MYYKLGLYGIGILPLDMPHRNITIYRDECSIRVTDCSIRIFQSFVIIILASPRLLPTAVQHY